METVKSVVGLGKKEQEEGQEPVSGEKGEGTVAEPFDAGNAEEATAQAAEKPAEADTMPPTATESVAPDGKPEQTPATQTTNDQSADPKSTPSPTNGNDASQDKKKSSLGGGGWFKNANPFAKRKDDTKGESDAQASAEAGQPTQEPEEKDLPPNHLGMKVPAGNSTNLADNIDQSMEELNAKKSSNGKQPEQDTLSPPAGGTDKGMPFPETRGPRASDLRGSRNSVAMPRPERGSIVNPDRIPTAGGRALGHERTNEYRPESESSSMAENRAGSLRGTRSSLAPSSPNQGSLPVRPAGRYGSNPGAIPTAGGKGVGSEQFERRKSRVTEDLTKVKTDEEGSPDLQTQANTHTNAGPPPEAAPVQDKADTAETSVPATAAPDSTAAAETTTPQPPTAVAAENTTTAAETNASQAPSAAAATPPVTVTDAGQEADAAAAKERADSQANTGSPAAVADGEKSKENTPTKSSPSNPLKQGLSKLGFGKKKDKAESSK